MGEQGAVGHPHGREAERRPQMHSQAGATWVVEASGVDEEDVGRSGQRADRFVEESALSQGEEARGVRRRDDATHHRLGIHVLRLAGQPRLSP